MGKNEDGAILYPLCNGAARRPKRNISIGAIEIFYLGL